MHDEIFYYKEDDKEYARHTIIWDDEPSFHVDLDVAVLREDKMTNILNAIEDENEEDMPLMFRRFVRELLAKLRLKLLLLLHCIKDDDILLRDMAGSNSQAQRERLDSNLNPWEDDLIFGFKRPRLSRSRSMSSDSLKFRSINYPRSSKAVELLR
jgi:hypothetical protein